MGLTKSELFSDEDNQIANLARLLAHPARIAILRYLIHAKSCVGNELVREIGLAQPTVSQHLKELKLAGLIKGEIQGTSVCYCIDFEQWKSMSVLLSDFLNQDFKAHIQCC